MYIQPDEQANSNLYVVIMYIYSIHITNVYTGAKCQQLPLTAHRSYIFIYSTCTCTPTCTRTPACTCTCTCTCFLCFHPQLPLPTPYLFSNALYTVLVKNTSRRKPWTITRPITLPANRNQSRLFWMKTEVGLIWTV